MPNTLPDESRWFFITGCQRSGTTMLRLVLECHSGIFCFDETQSYRVLTSREHDGPAATDLVGFKIPRLAEQLDQPRAYDFGLRDPPQGFYRGQNALFLVRDYRDVIASMLKLKGVMTWLESWAIPVLRDKMANELDFANRWKDEMAQCERAGSLAMFGALYWAYKNEALLRYVQRGLPVLPIQYETLVSEPRGELERICRFLNVPFEEALLDHPGHAHGEVFANRLTVGKTDPRRRIDAASVGQWKQSLSPEDERLASAIAGPIERRLARLLQGAPSRPPSS